MQGDTASPEPVNEGGTAFLNHDLLHLNPAYFQWMDKRIAYCNGLGIVPDVGLARSPVGAFANYSEAQLRTLWRYLLARYASYDVCWNLFGAAQADNSELLYKYDSFADLTRKYDLFGHPLTTVLLPPNPLVGLANPLANPAPQAPPAPAVNRGDTTAPGAAFDSILPRWLDVITLQGANPGVISRLLPLQKPVIFIGSPPIMSEAGGNFDTALLEQIWDVRMRDGYWGGIDDPMGVIAPDSPTLRSRIICNRFFRQTRYWRLEPHNDMLGGPNETDADKHRRLELQMQAGLIDKNGPIKTTNVQVLADPAHEYVLYFRHGGGAVLDLLESTGRIQVMWIDPSTGITHDDNHTQIMGGGYQAFVAPDNKDWVLYLKRL